ncbi:restriction endonuclease [Vibrio parahaemolyticus]|uniref:restriction endonuclease subunit S n=1 Tax=Vibrio parahaemolyticus TaxID=670 RepID=UPI00111D5437|nr:restriction endonuclease subunit S [Vibrio parahaemolyticus]TOD30841.1 restriction endonuclease [Vibrio parahaemolyticus]
MSDFSYVKKLLEGVEVVWFPISEVTERTTNVKWRETLKSHQYIDLTSVSVDTKKIIETTEVDASNAPSRAQKLVKKDDVIFATTRPTQMRYCLIDEEYNGAVASTGYCVLRVKRDVILPKWILYLISSSDFKKYLEENQSGSAYPAISDAKVKDYSIPIPCPDNPEKSLAIQAEIVRILDVFTAMTAELNAELNMRRKQYGHYQFELLKFTETTQQLSIGECCGINKGATPIKKATPGKYPLVATTEERQSSSEYQFDCPAVCVPLISSRGHGVASIDRIYYQDGKFALGNILCAITPNDSEVLSAKFLRYYLFDKKDVLLVPLMRGGANVSLTMDSLKKVKIPIPPIAEQQRIVRALDKFDEFVKALPREIELRQKQYEYYRDLLLSFPNQEKMTV